MPHHSGFISLQDARNLLGTHSCLDRLIEEFIVAKHIDAAGNVSVREVDVRDMARVLNRTSVRSPQTWKAHNVKGKKSRASREAPCRARKREAQAEDRPARAEHRRTHTFRHEGLADESGKTPKLIRSIPFTKGSVSDGNLFARPPLPQR